MSRSNPQVIIRKLRSMADPEAVAGMARFGGIVSEGCLGVPIPALRRMAKGIGKDHGLAGRLWESGIREARILASMVDAPDMVTPGRMDRWAACFDSWDLCDQCCNNLFRKTAHAHAKAVEWSGRREEYVKRAGFVLMAVLAVHDKTADNARFLRFLPFIEKGATDDRNFVKKAVSWALRQIGKRNAALNRAAVNCARRLESSDSRSARWIASDALRELASDKVKKRLR